MSIKEEYGLKYYEDDFRTSLTTWYNKLLDKSYLELDIGDVIRMLRQNILPYMALNKAIDLFLENPYAGDIEEGEILSLLLNHENLPNNRIGEIIEALERVKSGYLNYSWIEEDEKNLFIQNVASLLDKLSI